MFEVERPAVVLGSTQATAVVDAGACAAAGVEVARRAGGGGAVLVRPGEMLWVDVVLPAGDPLWCDDVSRAAYWLGQTWAEALEAVGVAAAAWHDGGLVRSRWSDLACFAGVGPAEVTVGGRKVIGISQRRTRGGARFQCAALLAGDQASLADLLALGPDDRRSARDALTASAAATRADATALQEAFLGRLALT